MASKFVRMYHFGASCKQFPVSMNGGAAPVENSNDSNWFSQWGRHVRD